jgi:p21-activated kinase 1
VRESLSTSTPPPAPGVREIEAGRGRKRAASSDSTEYSHYKKAKEESSLMQTLSSNENSKIKAIRSRLQGLVSEGNPESKYELRDRLGEGAFGVVWRGAITDSKRDVAIKVQHLSPENILRGRLVTEISILQSLKHINVTQYSDSYIIKDELWIVMDYVEGLSVEQIIEYNVSAGSKMQLSFISGILKSVLEAVKYLHSIHIIHRDIKGANILVGTNGDVKLADYGLSTQAGRCMDQCGTLCFMAPEVIKGMRYTKAIDIWSLGMTAVEMVNNDKPYYEVSSLEGLKDSIVNNVMPYIKSGVEYPHALKHFIKCCLNPDPKQRKPAAQLTCHPFFQATLYQSSAKEIGDTVISIKEHHCDIE